MNVKDLIYKIEINEGSQFRHANFRIQNPKEGQEISITMQSHRVLIRDGIDGEEQGAWSHYYGTDFFFKPNDIALFQVFLKKIWSVPVQVRDHFESLQTKLRLAKIRQSN